MRRLLVLALLLATTTRGLRAQEGFLVRASADGPELGMMFRLARHLSLEPGVFVNWQSNSSRTDSTSFASHVFWPGLSAALRWTGNAGGGVRAALGLRGTIGLQKNSFVDRFASGGGGTVSTQRTSATAETFGATVGAQIRISGRASLGVDYGIFYSTGHGTATDSTYFNGPFSPQPIGTTGPVHTAEWFNFVQWTVRIYRRNHPDAG